MSKNNLTIDQFKAWLEGVEDMQGKDWVPDKEQWKKIRTKIKQLTENQTIPTLQESIIPMQSYHEPFNSTFSNYNPLDQVPIGQQPSAINQDGVSDAPYQTPFK